MYTQETKIYTVILIMIITIVIIIIYYVYSIIKTHKLEIHNRKMYLLREINIIEAERERIAHNLHDSAGPELSLIKMKLDSISSVDLKEGVILEDTKSDIDLILTNLRQFSHNLMPVALKAQGLVSALYELCEKQSKSPLRIEFVAREEYKMPDETAIHLYRIVEEVIHNAIKHAQATLLKIQVDLIDNRLQIIAKDNGIGFDYNKSKPQTNGLGLKGYEYRTELLGGTYSIYSEKGKGVEVVITIPIQLPIEPI